METQRAKIGGETRGVNIRGDDDLSLRDSNRSAEIMDFPGGGHRGMAGRQGIAGDSGRVGQAYHEKRGRGQKVKQATRLGDAAWLVFCVTTAIVLIVT